MPTHSLYVTFSVVTYNTPYDELERVIKSLLLYPGEKKIFVADNSKEDFISQRLHELDEHICYKHFPKNVGFGTAHNWAISQAQNVGSKYHIVVNPDIYYFKDVVAPILDYMEQNPSVGELMPCILSPNGSVQYLPKLMPTPLMLLQRRLHKAIVFYGTHWMQRFEMRPMRNDRVYEVGHVSGCYAVMRMEALKRCGMFDQRYFLYFEDTDLSRRICKHYKTVYFPYVMVYHKYGHSAIKSIKCFKHFICSLVKYFCKWGWCFDKFREESNKRFLSQL